MCVLYPLPLHSILDIFQYKNILPGWLFIQLYIPFWIYSNYTGKGFRVTDQVAFTFHSGYIPILMVPPLTIGLFHFTFHSGYIPMLEASIHKSLHTFFTFHSGYIPMLKVKRMRRKDRYFTFHSGYIPISHSAFRTNLYFLYIPFWIYSNQTTQENELENQPTLHSILDIFQ